MICELVRKGARIGITANSHKVIRNLVDEVVKGADESGINLKCIQKVSVSEENQDCIIFTKRNEDVFSALGASCQVAAGTAWLWARPEAQQSVDVLFVDEAAQMSLANVLAISQAGTSLVLLGDPQQLDQPMQASHPEGTDVSALNHLLGARQTIELERGLFLEETWRLHPDICNFTSETFYESRLKPRPGLQNQRIVSAGAIQGSGLRFMPVTHDGNQNSSPEEANQVNALVREILGSDASWIDKDGNENPITLNDILIIAPYNAQVLNSRNGFPERESVQWTSSRDRKRRSSFTRWQHRRRPKPRTGWNFSTVSTGSMSPRRGRAVSAFSWRLPICSSPSAGDQDKFSWRTRSAGTVKSRSQ